MSGGLSDLASRMRAAVEEQEREARQKAEAAARVEAERARLAAEATAARDAALDDLEAFGKAVGLLEVKRTKKPAGVRFERDGKTLVFSASDAESIVVGEGVALRRDPIAGWQVVWPGDPPVVRGLEAGVEELLVTTLGFPRARPAVKAVEKPGKAKPTVHTMVVETGAGSARKGPGETPMVGGSVREFKGLLD